MSIEPVEWDSVFFERKIGRHHTSTPLSAEVLTSYHDSPYETIYVFSTRLQPLLEASGLQLADEKLTLSKHPQASFPSGSFYSPSTATPQIKRIFLSSGAHSRFKTDPVFSPYFEKLYATWMQNALSGSFADSFFCIGTPQDPWGLIVLQNRDDSTHISIIAVSESHRGQGIGKHLVEKAEFLAVEHKKPLLSVDTQASNHDAVRFYQKLGFTISNRVFIYHWHRQQ